MESFDSSKGIRLSTYAYSLLRFRFADFNRAVEQPLSVGTLEDLPEIESSDTAIGVDLEEQALNVQKALKNLTKRQRIILEKKYGIRRKPQSTSDIAKWFGVSCETIRKDKNAAIFALLENPAIQSLAS